MRYIDENLINLLKEHFRDKIEEIFSYIYGEILMFKLESIHSMELKEKK